MYGYTGKQFKSLKMWVDPALSSARTDRQWAELCERLFAEGDTPRVRKKGAHKTILHAALGGTPSIIKVYSSRGPAGTFQSIFRHSRAYREFAAAAALCARGIPAPRPLLMAEKRTVGCVTASLVAFAFLPEARELRDLFFDRDAFALHERRAILKEFGRLTAQVFSRGVFQYDYSLNNFMMCREENAWRIYCIDFERMQVGKPLPERHKQMLLAKLNRVGKEVSRAERLCFLRSYRQADTGRDAGLKELARNIQHRTLHILRRDVSRRRLTSLYTHSAYERIKRPGYDGLYKRGYDPEEIIRQVTGIPSDALQTTLSLVCGGTACRLLAVQFHGRGEAADIWAAVTALLIAGLPLELPHVLIEDGTRGFIIMPPSALQHLHRGAVPPVIKKNFQAEIEKVCRHVPRDAGTAAPTP